MKSVTISLEVKKYLKIYLATWLLEKNQGIALTNVNADTRLISYWHTKEKEKELITYIQTGTNGKEEA